MQILISILLGIIISIGGVCYACLVYGARYDEKCEAYDKLWIERKNKAQESNQEQ